MQSLTILSLLFLFSLVVSGIPVNIDDAKKELESYRNSSESNLRTALGKVNWFVLKSPLVKLKDLTEGGKKDQDNIRSFEGPGDKDKASQDSVVFWKRKMDAVIKPYLDNPSVFQGLIVDPAFPLDDPTWNTTEAYKKVEQEIVRSVENASLTLKEEVSREIQPRARTVNEVTSDSYRQHLSEVALRESLYLLKMIGQWAKSDAASGNSEKAGAYLRQALGDTIEDFKQRLRKISTQTV